MFNAIYLSVPEKEDRREVVLANRPKLLRKWLTALANENKGMMTRLVYDRLSEINRTSFDRQQLWDALNQLTPHYSVAFQYLLARLRATGLPVSAGQQKIAELTLNMSKELAGCYYNLLNLFTEKKAGRMERKALPIIIGQLIRGYTEILFIHYLLYLDEPDWIWYDLNALYKLALEQKLNTIKFTDSRLALKKKTTIQEIFIQIILLRISDPYRLTQSEALAVYTILEKWVGLVQLAKLNSSSARRFHGWLINLDEDKCPKPADASPSTHVGQNYLVLDLQPLIKLIQDHIDLADSKLERFEELSSNEIRNTVMPRYLLDYLEEFWSNSHSMNSDDSLGDEELLVSVGLKNTHQQFGHSPIIEERIVGDWLASRVSKSTLSCAFDQAEQIAIGSLVGYKPVSDENSRRDLGIVYRLSRKSNDDPIHFEIVKFEGKIYPAGIQPIIPDNQNSLYQRALMYLDKINGENKTILLVDSKTLGNGQAINALVQEQLYTIELFNRKKIGLNLYRFECQPVKSNGGIPPKGFDFL